MSLRSLGRAAPRTALVGGQVVDGTGAPARAADVLLDEGRVVAVEPEVAIPAGSDVVDVTGRVVAPGFIDLHTHSDFTLPHHPLADSMTRQGVTTIVVGNCGFSTFPVGPGERADQLRQYTSFFGPELDWTWDALPSYAAHLRGLGVGPNLAFLVGHGSVRIATMGFASREPTGPELARMREHVDEAMRAGAFGLSSGLIYPPASYADEHELSALAEVVASYGGFYATHMRNEGPQLLEAMEEAIRIARTAGASLHLSHHKVLGRANWGMTHRSLARLDEVRAEGLDVTADQYPYPASSTNLAALAPPSALQGGTEGMQRQLHDGVGRARIRRELLEGPDGRGPVRAFEPDTVMLSSIRDPGPVHLVGRTLEAIAAERGEHPADLMLDLLRDHGGDVEVVIFAIGEEDIRRVMRHASVAVASDGWTLHPDAGGQPHPRSYGTFARVLGRYVRDEGVLTLEEAVRKMSSLPAERLGLTDRGRLQVGAQADVVVFDAEQVEDSATFLAPHGFAVGVDRVYVNGLLTVHDGAMTGVAAGAFLRPGGG